jgi:hypothetical protein
MKRKKFIILESQLNLKEVIIFRLESHFNFEAIRVNTPEECFTEIHKHFNDIAFLFIGNSTSNTDAYDIYKFFLQNDLKDSIVFYDFSNGKSQLSYGENPIAKRIERTNDIHNIISTVEANFKIDESILKKEYTPISINSFQFLKELEHNVYIRLQSGRFLHLFREEDSVNESDILKYQSKGVHQLYLKKDAYTWILKQIQKEYPKILNNPDYKIDLVNPESIEKEFEETIQKINKKIEIEGLSIEFDPEIMKELPEKILAMKNKLKKNIYFKDLVTNVIANKKLENFIENRRDLLIYFSCAIAKSLDWDSNQITDKLIYCAMTHDIILHNYPKIVIYDAVGKLQQNIKVLNSFEERLYLKHPEIMSKIVEKDSNAPKDAINIVLQHHEKANGVGFPLKFDHRKINALSVVFNVSLDVANELMNGNKIDFPKYINNKKLEYKGAYYRKALIALEKLLKENKM